MLTALVVATRRRRKRTVMVNDKPIDLPEVNDLSAPEQAQQRAIYKMLVRDWWPHLLHGPTRYAYNETCLVFGCQCGASLTVTHEAANELGLI